MIEIVSKFLKYYKYLENFILFFAKRKFKL